MAELYFIANGAMATTAAMPSVPTGTAGAIKTMLQVKMGTQNKGKIVEWGVSFDGSAAAVPGKCELVETGSIFATVTASAAADIMKFGDPNAIDPTTSNFILTTTGTGYTASAEGSIVATRLFDLQLVAPTNQYVKQFPLGREPEMNVSTATRIRVTMPVVVNCYAYMVIEV